MTEQAIALILGALFALISMLIVPFLIWVQNFLDAIEKGKRLPGSVNISDCVCKEKTVQPEKKMPFNDWAKKYIRPFSNAKPKR